MTAQEAVADPRLLVIGAGRMGGALVKGWLNAGLPADRLAVVDPKPPERPHGLRRYAQLADWADAAIPAEVVVLAVKPDQADSVLAALCRLQEQRPALLGGAVLVSIAAGVPLAALQHAGLPALRAMPNLPAEVGAGITALFAPPGTPGDLRARVEWLFALLGRVVWLRREDDVDLATAVSGSGPAYLFAFTEALEGAARALGFDDDTAAALARQTVIGAARLLEQSGEDPAVLRARVTSPGGTTEAALGVLVNGGRGLESLLTEALAAARRRAGVLFGREA